MYTFSLVEWATMPWLGEAPLSLSLGNGGVMAQWENEWMRGGCGWLERQTVSRNPWEA